VAPFLILSSARHSLTLGVRPERHTPKTSSKLGLLPLVAIDFNLSLQELFIAKYEHNIKKYYNK
jgi:hypothetical protein